MPGPAILLRLWPAALAVLLLVAVLYARAEHHRAAVATQAATALADKLAVTKRVLAADRRASTAKAARDRDDAASTATLQEMIHEADRTDGDALGALFNGLR